MIWIRERIDANKDMFLWKAAEFEKGIPILRQDPWEMRAQIVAESLGNIAGTCDGCSAGLAEMYQDYIDGKRELREINMAFHARYISGDEGPERKSCGYER